MPTYASARVVLDACVLYPPTLRDTLLRLAEAGLLQPYWSEAILDEVARNLRTAGPAEAQVQHLLGQLRRAFPEALVEGYEGRLAEARNHPKDRHVVAAALHAGCAVIITDNLKDFRPEHLPEGVEALSADDFLMGLLERSPRQVVEAVRTQAAAARRPPTTPKALLERLSRRAPRFAVAATGALSVRTDTQSAALLDQCERVLARVRRREAGPGGVSGLLAELKSLTYALCEASPEFELSLRKAARTRAHELVRGALKLMREASDAGDADAAAQARALLHVLGFNPTSMDIDAMSDEALHAMVEKATAPKH